MVDLKKNKENDQSNIETAIPSYYLLDLKLGGSFLSYNWDLGEAGGPTYTASKQSRFSLDLEEGDYSVTLTVEDPDGESNSVSHSFSVTNLPPVAIIK